MSAAPFSPDTPSFPAGGPLEPLLQVGGHAGAVQTTEDGSLVIKTALATEHAFYEAITSDDRFASLREHVPGFLGTLKLAGQLGGESGTELQPAATTSDNAQSLVLENICFYFQKPCVLDVKLGTILVDETATEEKRARMERRARETTSGRTGIRLTGFQIYDRVNDTYVQVTKDYGRTIRPDQLPEGIAKFLPLAERENDIGLPGDLLRLVIRGISAEIELIHRTLEELELQMVGASLLVVYEGSEPALTECLEEMQAEAERRQHAFASGSENSEQESEDDEDSESDSDNGTTGLPFAVRLIDFAHTRFGPDNGTKEGVLLGMRTVRELLENRLRDIEARGGLAGQSQD